MKKILVLLIAIFLSMPAYAQEEKLIEVPIIFTPGESPVMTSACLEIKEKFYNAEHSDWESFKKMALDAPEKTLIETITAIQQKDSSRFKKLSHPEFVRDEKNFEQQKSAYFQQFDGVQMGEVKGYLKFDNFVVFYIQLKFEEKSWLIDFPFLYNDNGTLGFIRNLRNESPLLSLTDDWFRSDWGWRPANNKLPVYCEPSRLDKTTHELILNNDTNHSDTPTKLLLVGAELNKNESYAGLFNSITKMQEALTSNRLNDFFDGFTEDAKRRNKDWFSQEKEEDLRNRYIENFLAQKPFFVFDADPLYVVYIRTNSLEVKALNFMRNAEGQFKLAGESIGSPWDKIFKSERFIEAAKEKKPFSSWEITKKGGAQH